MAINSCSKGKVGERECADFLKEHGFEARRGQQFSGGGESPDVVHNIPGVHIEVKRVENFNAYKALEQAKRDAKPGMTPVVFHRRNRKDWVVVLDAKAYLDLVNDRKLLGHNIKIGTIKPIPRPPEPVTYTPYSE